MGFANGGRRAERGSRGMRWARWVTTLMSAVSLALAVGVPSATAALAAPNPADPSPAAESASASASASASLPSSAGVTVAGGNSVAVDVLGVGYEQVVRLNGSRVEVAEPVTRGGAVVRSFDAGASHAWPRLWDSPMFYGGANMADRVTGHSASRVAVAGGFIYVSTLRTKDGGPFIPKVVDGSVVRKYTPDGVQVGERVFPGAFAVTSLAGFEHEGKPYLAIGLNYSGVRIADPTVPWLPDVHALMEHFKGPNRFGSLPTNERDQITELGFGVVGTRVQLMVGVLTGDMPALLAFDANTGQELWAKNLRPNDPAKFEWPQEIEFSPYEVNGRVQIAVGWPTLGRLSFMDAVDGTDRGNIDGGVVGTVRFFTDASGEPRVGYRHGRASGWSSHVAKQDAAGRPVVLDNGAERDLEWMVPGYRPWSILIDNRSRSEITFNSFAGSSRAEGCWLTTALHGATNPLPSQPQQAAAGAMTGPFMSAHSLWGESCGDHPGVFYLQIGPAGEPGQRRVVQLHADAKGIRVADQGGGGPLVAHVESGGPHGARIVIADRYAPPSIVGAPVVDVSRLTPAEPPGRVPTENVNDPSRPVHRFTVSGVSWNVPGAGTDLTEVALPLSLAEGSVDGEQWNTLGTIASPLTPTREGDLLTLGDAVFDWQTAPGAPKDYRYIRVSAGGAVSNVIDVRAQLPAPAPTDLLKGTGGGISITGAGMPRANGLDQAPMRVSLYSKSRALDVVQHADLYERIYFRDTTSKALITGLGDPAEPDQLIMLSLQRGQYANDGLTAASTTSIGVYVSARFRQQDRQIMAVIKGDGVESDGTFSSVPFRPTATALAPNPNSTGAGGVSIGTCAEGACAIANPDAAPALHSLTSTSVSLQLRTIAVPGSASLPLVEPERNAELLDLPEDAFEIRDGRAVLRNPKSFAASPTFSGHVVSHGERVALENLYVTAR